MIKVDKLSFSYEGEKIILTDISFSIEKGEVVAILGPNGSGKTTLLYLLAGIIPHLKKGIIEGTVRIENEEVSKTPFEEIVKKVGFVMQNPEEQFVALNVKHELLLGLSHLNMTEKEVIFNKFVSIFELNNLLSSSPQELSMGQKQKVIMASVIMREPEYIFLDEPFSFVDIHSQRWICKIIKQLKEKGKTIILNTHKIDFLEGVVDRVVGIKHGRLEFFKPFDDLTQSDYRTLYNIKNNYGTIKNKKNNTKKSEDILLCNNLYFKYPYQSSWLISDLNFGIPDGQVIGLIGKNGTGKSTLLFILAGLLKPQKGKVFLKNKEIYKMSFKELSQNVGIVFQNPLHQLFCETIEEELIFGLKNIGLKKSEIEKRIEYVKTYFNLPDLHTDPNHLSFGWKKILSIALVISMKPHIMLFDEPDSSLDPYYQHKIVSIIRKLNDEGITMLLTGHDIPMMEKIADNLFCMKDGRLYRYKDYENCFRYKKK